MGMDGWIEICGWQRKKVNNAYNIVRWTVSGLGELTVEFRVGGGYGYYYLVVYVLGRRIGVNKLIRKLKIGDKDLNGDRGNVAHFVLNQRFDGVTILAYLKGDENGCYSYNDSRFGYANAEDRFPDALIEIQSDKVVKSLGMEGFGPEILLDNLMESVRVGNAERVALLIHATTRVTRLGEKAEEIMAWAMAGNHVQVVHLLLTIVKEHDAVLRWAMEKDHDDVIECLLDVVVDVDAVIAWAMEKDHRDIVRCLIPKTDKNLAEIVTWAIDKDYDNIVRILLQKGVETMDSVVLPWALEKLHPEVVALVLRRVKDTKPILKWAMANKFPKVVYRLLPGLDDYKPVLDWAMENNFPGIVRGLFSRIEDVDTVVNWAREQGHDHIVINLSKKIGQNRAAEESTSTQCQGSEEAVREGSCE